MSKLFVCLYLRLWYAISMTSIQKVFSSRASSYALLSISSSESISCWLTGSVLRLLMTSRTNLVSLAPQPGSQLKLMATSPLAFPEGIAADDSTEKDGETPTE